MLSIRVASFNVENLLHAGARFARDPGRPGYSAAMYADKIAWIRGVLDEGSVDLVGFQELFSRKALDEMLTGSRLAGATVIAPDLDDNITAGTPEPLARGPFCGLVTTLPVKTAAADARVFEFPQEVRDRLVVMPDGGGTPVALPVSKFQRPVLRVDVTLPNGADATVFVAHLKSKLGQFLPGEDRDDPMAIALASVRSLVLRAAESVALRALVLAAVRDTDRPVLLLGDLNDELSAVSTQTIAGPNPPRFLSGPKKAAMFDTLLHSAHDIQDRQTLRDVDYTHIFDGRYQLLDHVFVSQELFHANPKHIGKVRNTRIFNDHLLDTGLAINVPSGLSARSDHGVVVTEIELEPATP
ncbi:MAG: hypothetical protein K1X88_11450 [Nannocystaceae bacterium]|nr:hypothetical protein [Nannocystaceae bacterium]